MFLHLQFGEQFLEVRKMSKLVYPIKNKIQQNKNGFKNLEPKFDFLPDAPGGIALWPAKFLANNNQHSQDPYRKVLESQGFCVGLSSQTKLMQKK